MERIELFDNYINNQLPDAQRLEFDKRLKYDEEFASEFRIYLTTVDGICREAHQDNMDFGMAMKKLTKDQLREIIGPRHNQEEISEKSTRDVTPTKTKTLQFKPWVWQVVSLAAMVVIAYTLIFNIRQQSRYDVYDAIYASADLSFDPTRDASEEEAIDVSKMDDKELQSLIPTLEKQLQDPTTSEAAATNGYTLAMIYLKFHEKDKAVCVLTQLIDRYDDNEDYTESVNRWKSILSIIQ